eukprot:TRINITY_DN8317_c0_g1_i1.p1 TRINITY_DN8317_c0_g1~~TRINITY_DN8317_c0_g1_i1.p1  ORF type:complete len:462 (+),score=114.43 TRINITY_DN8317_c0_g1_i1:165-1550(+)
MSSISEQEATLMDMFPGVNYEHIKDVLEKDGFDGAINYFLAEGVGEEEPRVRQDAWAEEETAMHEQLDAETRRQQEGAVQKSILGDILAKTGNFIQSTARAIAHRPPVQPSSSSPVIHDIEATSEGGLVEPPHMEPVVSPTSTVMSTATTTSQQLNKALENTKTVLDAMPGKDMDAFKDRLNALPPHSSVIAVIGKPGVGKTSVINAMLGTPLLPTKPAGIKYTVQNLESGEAYYVVNGVRVEKDLLPFKLKEKMEEVVGGLGVEEVVVQGPGLFPDDMEIKEVSAEVGVAANWVGVVIVNGMTEEEVAGYREIPNVTLISVKEEAGDVLVVEPRSYLSTVLLQSVGAAGPYAGSFNILRERVNTLRATLKAAHEDSSNTLLTEISAAATKKINEMIELQHACGFDSDLSRPPIASEAPLTDDEVPYVPAQPTYQPPPLYMPAESSYVPQQSMWQPDDSTF